MIDLHCHSTFSDGTCTPEELVELARQGGLKALSLTDHDTTDGLPRLTAAAARAGIQPVSGIELSAEFPDATLHILGYFFDPACAEFQEALDWVRAGRNRRNLKILENLNRLGYALTLDDVRLQAGEELIGRPHFAAALLAKGCFKHKDAVFQQLLGKGKAAYAERPRLDPQRCIELIRRAGGVAVAAHPGHMNFTTRRLRRLFRALKEQGLGGIEVWHSSHPPHLSNALLRICNDLDLAATGGSDFHGRHTPDLTLGRGFGDLTVDDNVLDALRARC